MWGAPWRSSAFLFEHVGGVLAKRFHGNTQINKQIFSSFVASNALKRFAIHHIPNASPDIQELYEELDCNMVHRSDIPSETIGKGRATKFDAFEIQLLEQHLEAPIQCHACVKFSKLACKGRLYCTKITLKITILKGTIP